MKIQVYKGKNKNWYWRALAKNGNIVADGSEGYSTSQNARRAARNIINAIRNVKKGEFAIETI